MDRMHHYMKRVYSSEMECDAMSEECMLSDDDVSLSVLWESVCDEWCEGCVYQQSRL